ncbi:MAG TPA: very short patch repair endonuclease [Sphingomonas sp.]|uniref:very short patch repair endonuclease n=1 Tax=Sphingomonas sp. TaxID=28214 RepID=UPI002ED7947B
MLAWLKRRSKQLVDGLTPERRSWLMSQVRGKNTTPEMRVRRTAHALGLRFRLHRGDLPGTPDLVFPKHRTALFVHGCFWHRHQNCPKSSLPKSRVEYWECKFQRNVLRDSEVEEALRKDGWRVALVWECETKNAAQLREALFNMFCIAPGS